MTRTLQQKIDKFFRSGDNCRLWNRYKNIYGARFDGASFYGARFYGANFYGARFDGARFDGARFYGANFDRKIKKLFVSKIWRLKKHGFQVFKNYFIAYKSFSEHYNVPKKWRIKENSVISEHCDNSEYSLCARGINVGTKKWCEENCKKDIEELLNIQECCRIDELIDLNIKEIKPSILVSLDKFLVKHKQYITEIK